MKEVMWLIISVLCGLSPLMAFGAFVAWQMRNNQNYP